MSVFPPNCFNFFLRKKILIGTGKQDKRKECRFYEQNREWKISMPLKADTQDRLYLIPFEKVVLLSV